MKPLQAMAMGYVFIALYAKFNGYDAYADPVGWALVLYGVHLLPHDFERRGTVLVAALVAGAVSVPLWFPAVAEWFDEADPSLAWAVGLPQLAFAGLLCHVLARGARDAGEHRAAAWLRTLLTLFVVVALVPVLVFGGGLESLGPSAAAAVQLAQLALIWMLFLYSGREWAGAPQRQSTP